MFDFSIKKIGTKERKIHSLGCSIPLVVNRFILTKLVELDQIGPKIGMLFGPINSIGRFSPIFKTLINTKVDNFCENKKYNY